MLFEQHVFKSHAIIKEPINMIGMAGHNRHGLGQTPCFRLHMFEHLKIIPSKWPWSIAKDAYNYNPTFGCHNDIFLGTFMD
jgi:hypothetical protein